MNISKSKIKELLTTEAFPTMTISIVPAYEISIQIISLKECDKINDFVTFAAFCYIRSIFQCILNRKIVSYEY